MTLIREEPETKGVGKVDRAVPERYFSRKIAMGHRDPPQVQKLKPFDLWYRLCGPAAAMRGTGSGLPGCVRVDLTGGLRCDRITN